MLSNLIDRMKLPFRKDKELYLSLRKIIGFYPHDISYYKLALMHKSMYKRNAKGKPVNNERLEFLGDAVLDATVGDIVYRHFPGKREGFLTNTRSKLVQRDTLNRLAQEMGINQLILSSGRSQSHNSYMGGNAFEALVGAIYLDRGYDACMEFIIPKLLLQPLLENSIKYGFQKKPRLHVRMRGWLEEDALCFTVEDNGGGVDAATLEQLRGILRSEEVNIEHNGLQNINRRIWLGYGGDSGLTIDSAEGEGFTVKLKLRRGGR